MRIPIRGEPAVSTLRQKRAKEWGNLRPLEKHYRNHPLADTMRGMDTEYLFRRLVLPLIGASVVSIFVSIIVAEPWKGLLVNLSATFLGSIVTVFFVDAVLRRHEEVRWQHVRSKVLQNVERVANVVVSSVRQAFGIEPPDVLLAQDVSLMRQEMIRMAEGGLFPLQDGVDGMSAKSWQTMIGNFQSTVLEIDRIITLFSRNLDVQYMTSILEIQGNLMRASSNYETWRDLLEAPYHPVPGLHRIGFKQRTVKALYAEDIGTLLALCGTLLRELPPPVSVEE